MRLGSPKKTVLHLFYLTSTLTLGLDSVSVAICTVKSEAAASLPFVSGRLRSGFYSKTSLRDNGNGTKTLLVEHQRMGTRIIVR